MDTIQLPDQPILLDNPTDREVADRVDIAAALIERDGLEVGDLWTDGLLLGYRDGLACCLIGALAVACGYRTTRQAEDEFIGHAASYDLALGYTVEIGPHPVLARVMWELCCTEVVQLQDWSDSARPDQVVARLRQAAASLRIQAAVTCISCGAAYGTGHYSWCDFQTALHASAAAGAL